MFKTVLAPATFRVVSLVPGFLTIVAVLRVIAGDEILQILETQRLLLQRMMDVGAVVVDPDLSRPRFLAGRFVVEEQYIGLHALRVENASG
ncbi:hypothetical protein D3C79_809740 [compost metagenome]